MTTLPLGIVLRHLRRLVTPETTGELNDGQLLERFAGSRDEAAFTELVKRHGPMVWNVCRSALRHGWSRWRTKNRLERGREHLRRRLARRGLAAPAGLLTLATLGGAAEAVVPAVPADAAVRAALAGTGAAGPGGWVCDRVEALA